MLNKKKGFTLIELLVVISIISLLATLAITALKNAQMKSRDTKRLAEINQLQKALDLYYNENNIFPSSPGCSGNIPNAGWCNSIQSLIGAHWIDNGSNNLGEFIAYDPLDPKPDTTATWLPYSGGTYFYFASGYGGTGQWYMIVFGLENTNHNFQNEDGVTACDGHYFHYGNGSNGIITIGRSCQI